MDIEQLKLILETANAAGEGATRIFYWWLAYKVLGDILVTSILTTAMVGLYRLAKRMIDEDGR